MTNMYIERIITEDYEDNTYIYIPSERKTIKYSIFLNNDDSFYFNSFYVYFLDSKNGFKYKLNSSESYFTEGYVVFEFLVDKQSSEMADIDFIELLLNTDERSYSFKKEIKIKYLKNSNKSFNYDIGDMKVLDSNLLSIRNKIMSPAWSTVNKNTLSNSTKLLDQLHSTFSSSYSKINEYVRMSYDITYEPSVYNRMFLTHKPRTVLRYISDYTREELKETTDIYSSLYALDLYPMSFNQKISTVILEPYSNIQEEIYELNTLLPTFLYFKKNKSIDSRYVTCVVTGYDEFENEIIESILVRQDIFTRTQNRFHTITDINYSDNTVEITNCVDLKYNHYVINNNFIIPSIVDTNYRTYKPLVKIRSNNELTHNIITLDNPLSDTIDSFSKFNIDTKNNPLTSLYITENLDVIYTYTFENNTILNYSKLNIDFTKNIYNHITMNNNKYINVSEVETLIGDWIDVKVNVKDWSNDKDDTCLLIQVRNKDTMYYYDAENNTLSENKVLIYTQTLIDSVLDFSIQVENDQPYIFTLYNSSLKEKVAACSIANSVVPYKTEIIDNKSLVLLDNSLYLSNDIQTESINFNKESEYLYVTLHSKDYSTIKYLLNFGDYYLSDNSTNINSDYYEYISKDNGYGIPIVIKINLSFLDTKELKIGTALDINNGLCKEDSVVILKISRNEIEQDLIMNPKQTSEDTVKTEYTINTETLEWSVNNDY